MSDYILAIDQGTTSSRAILFNREGHNVHSAQEEFPQHFPNDGWVEHEPADIWETVERTFQKAIAKIDTSNDVVRGIGITNQRETTLIWDRKTGKPLYRAIVWQDRRTSEYCKQLKNKGLESLISDKTGLLIDPYFSATKIRWILENIEGAQARAERGELAFGTVDSLSLIHI